ncbi:hypothetical protein GQX74_009741 [Glossina fuscipes]|nr:hypothetical protein GQX74_009741 [Glossina fuscipes]
MTNEELSEVSLSITYDLLLVVVKWNRCIIKKVWNIRNCANGGMITIFWKAQKTTFNSILICSIGKKLVKEFIVANGVRLRQLQNLWVKRNRKSQINAKYEESRSEFRKM